MNVVDPFSVFLFFCFNLQKENNDKNTTVNTNYFEHGL